MKTLKIAEVFTDAPGGRLRKDGPFSGEEFREDYLMPSLDSLGISESLLVDFDGGFGYASSFLHEIFFAFYEKYPKYGNTRLIVLKSDEEPCLCKEVIDLLYAKTSDVVPTKKTTPLSSEELLKKLNAMYNFQDCTCTKDQESGKNHTICRRCLLGNLLNSIHDFIKNVYSEVS